MYETFAKQEAFSDIEYTIKTDITQHEIAALRTRYNLADAHTHQEQSPSQRRIVENLPSLWRTAARQTQYASEQDFVEAFYSLHGQYRALQRRNEIYLVYAASIATHITATYLQKKTLRVGLIEPCFDNLHDLMKHMQVPLVPLGEDLLSEADCIFENLSARSEEIDAVFLVDPNNPTGFSLFSSGAEAFQEVVRFCVERNKLLILDFCFAAFILASRRIRIDAYEILEDSGVSYIAMEDSGKTWPLQDAKCATLMASADINADIYPIVTSVLLNVSPFILKIVTEYVRDSERDDFSSVRDLLDRNRDFSRKCLDGAILRYVSPRVETSVAWFEIVNTNWTADSLQAYLLKFDLYILSGRHFFWRNPEKGQRFIRIALAREPRLFATAMDVMQRALAELNQ